MQHHRGTFTLTKPELRALLAFACRDNTRPHLNCVRFTPKLCQVAATDGASLVIFTAEGKMTKDTAFSLPLQMVQDAMGVMRRKRQVMRAHLSGRYARLCVEVFEDEDAQKPLAVFREARSEGAEQFPAPSKLLKMRPPLTQRSGYAVAPRLLGRMAPLDAVGCVGLTHHGARGALDPIFYTGRAGDVLITVVLMPIRV